MNSKIEARAPGDLYRMFAEDMVAASGLNDKVVPLQRLDDDTIRKLTEPLHRMNNLLQRIDAKLDKMMRNEKEPRP